ncbi:hypothetical protein [Aurantiacibacter spongiae]|uniref:Uncharacterized protein n=1 Tax=Aurantiacibacter spongiae TaxID=2488860 RepID=A0A3N5CVD7_9SPHN|nr:hypothetical protein [Aurantiacibacter spongiae]RPF71430.1 hypothetical protein EG799_07245 [Aurantiacibacter spongiae]
MSFDINVHVPGHTWPTARQLDAALVELRFPARLGDRGADLWESPLAPVPLEPIITTITDQQHARLLGVEVGAPYSMPNEMVMPVLLDGDIRDPDFGIQSIDEPSELAEQMAELGAARPVAVGDRLVWFSHHTDPWNYNAAMYVLVALIRSFDGFGFELQGMSCGREDFASELLDSLYPDPAEAARVYD